jgi:hypothetical protein
MTKKRALQIPGEEGPLNNADDDPNQVAAEREGVLQSLARAHGTDDIAPPPDLDAGDTEADVMLGGERVRVLVPQRRINPQVSKFGPESKLPRGTAVRKDGTPAQGSDVPYGYIGDIMTPQGRLINRVIPVAVLQKANQTKGA